MKINASWKIAIGVGSLWVIGYPFVVVAFLFAASGSIALAAGNGSETPPALMLPFLSFFFILFPLMFMSGLLQMGLSGFYLAHVIKNKAASDVLRIIFGVGVFYLPFIAMPFYYFVYVWPDSPPAWALETNRASV